MLDGVPKGGGGPRADGYEKDSSWWGVGTKEEYLSLVYNVVDLLCSR